MEPADLVVFRDVAPDHAGRGRAVIFDRLLDGGLRGVSKHVFRYRELTLRTHRIETLRRPLLTAMLVRAAARQTAWLEDEMGRREKVTTRFLLRLIGRFTHDAVQSRSLLRRVRGRVQRLGDASWQRRLDPTGAPVYLRTDLWFGLPSGGSVGHVAGVANELHRFSGRPCLLLATDVLPLIRGNVEQHLLAPSARYWDFRELPELASNDLIERSAIRILDGLAVAFLYHRYSLNNFTGVALSKHFGIPLVVEYNGSETWMHAHWGRRLEHAALSSEIEQLNLAAADLVVVVSEAMKAELAARGIASDAVLVNPNGVDPDAYSPDVDGSDIRRQFGLEGKFVFGFIGTFGPWHGADVLATAFARLIERRPDLASSVRLLMIGKGPTMLETRRRIRDGGVEPLTVFTGQTAQADGPAHLAACDVLVSPHVPNADGTPFFGSPTKLFEYMAMGKPIVASDLDQIGEVLDHDETAWLVPPGDADALADGMAALIDDRERAARLGRAARARAVSHHTWRRHTERIVDALRERCA